MGKVPPRKADSMKDRCGDASNDDYFVTAKNRKRWHAKKLETFF